MPPYLLAKKYGRWEAVLKPKFARIKLDFFTINNILQYREATMKGRFILVFFLIAAVIAAILAVLGGDGIRG